MSNTIIEGGITEQLAAWLTAQRWAHFPPGVQAKAVDVVFDSVGAMTACSILPEVHALVALAAAEGARGECTVIGHPLVTSAINAALCKIGRAHV